MYYEAIDRWNNGDSYLEHSVLSRHKYVKKVGEGSNARYFYSMDEYNRFLANTRSAGQRSADIKKQDLALTTLRSSAKNGTRAKINNYYKQRYEDRVNSGFFNQKGPYHSLSSSARGIGTLKKSGKDYTDAHTGHYTPKDQPWHSAPSRGIGTLRKSAKGHTNAKTGKHINIMKTGLKFLKTSWALSSPVNLIWNIGAKKYKKKNGK